MGFFDKLKDAAKETKESMANSMAEMKEKNAENKMLENEAKAPIEGSIVRYQVVYIGGFPNKPVKVTNSTSLGFNIMPDRFIFKPELLAKQEWFGDDNYEILYSDVKKFEILKHQVGTAEALIGNGDTKSLEQENNIAITHTDSQGREIVTRVEMLTGVTVYGQAQKCMEMMDLLREHDILKLLNKETPAAAPANAANDIPGQIAKLAQLKDAGILSEEEFNAKKADLLAKM